MAIVVVNCFHWIGYHFVEMLLERGEKVIGVHSDDCEKTTFLSMFVARNSLFTEQSSIPTTTEKAIVIGDSNNFPDIRPIIHLIEAEKRKENTTSELPYIQMPLLYGEWMPMNENGVYIQNAHISYDSDRFMKEAVYVKAFIKTCLTILDGNEASSKDKKTNKNKELILENNAHFRDNRTMKENIEVLQKHYLQYASVYYK